MLKKKQSFLKFILFYKKNSSFRIKIRVSLLLIVNNVGINDIGYIIISQH